MAAGFARGRRRAGTAIERNARASGARFGAVPPTAQGPRPGQRAHPPCVWTNLRTSKKLSVAYLAAGRDLADALSAVNHQLRDVRSGDVFTINPALLDLLHGLAATVGSQRAFHGISGYRPPATNETLRQSSSGVASGSLHLCGQAINIRLADVPLATLRHAARSMRLGGVGCYAKSDFVHLDAGRVRSG